MKSKRPAAALRNSGGKVALSESTRLSASNTPSLEEIRQRAYDIYLERGGTHGHDLDDWLQAERELEAKHTGQLG